MSAGVIRYSSSWHRGFLSRGMDPSEYRKVKFAFANALKRHFDARADFYSLDLGGKCFACRGGVDICRRDIADRCKEPPDAVVVMLNPGSARPRDVGYRPPRIDAATLLAARARRALVPIRPDSATYQVMRLMALQRWTRARILGLTDLRLQDCVDIGDLYARAGGLDATHPHSLFHPGRSRELEAALETRGGGPVIAAWGYQKPLEELAARAMERLGGRLIGLRLREGGPWFRHASPRQKSDKLQWLEDITELLGHPRSSRHRVSRGSAVS